MTRIVFLLGILALAGCDKLTGAADQKIADAEAIGFACRVADKQPEVCMKENDAYSPSSILDGWKSADQDIKDGKLGGKSGNETSSDKKEGEAAATEGEKPTDGKPVAKDEKTAGKTVEPPKDGKPVKADAAGKNDSAPKSAAPAKLELPAKPDVSKDAKPAEAKDKAQH